MPMDMLIALRLAKEGFGTPEAVLGMRVDVVMAAFEYSNFLNDYEETSSVINREVAQ